MLVRLDTVTDLVAANRGLEARSALVAFQLLRIVQEALANVRKHARAHNIWITFSTPNSDRLQMSIRDDGQGFDPSTPADSARKSFGVASMRERVESLGGELQIESQPGAGTLVVVAIPLKQKAETGSNGLLAAAAG
jgi:signal transduction histidine kinase